MPTLPIASQVFNVSKCTHPSQLSVVYWGYLRTAQSVVAKRIKKRWKWWEGIARRPCHGWFAHKGAKRHGPVTRFVPWKASSSDLCVSSCGTSGVTTTTAPCSSSPAIGSGFKPSHSRVMCSNVARCIPAHLPIHQTNCDDFIASVKMAYCGCSECLYTWTMPQNLVVVLTIFGSWDIQCHYDSHWYHFLHLTCTQLLQGSQSTVSPVIVRIAIEEPW